MLSRTLTDSEIFDRCQYLTSTFYPYYEELRECMHILHITGCRETEVFEIERWTHVSDYTFLLSPQKGNHERTIELDALCDNFRACVINQTKPFLGRSVWQLHNLFNRLKTWVSFEVGEKNRQTYIFRYNYVKQLHASGYTLYDIAVAMGYTNTTTPQAYLEAQVIENFELPPINTILIGGTYFSDTPLNFDDGGVGIRYPNNNSDNSADYGYLYNYSAAERVVQYFPDFKLANSSEMSAFFNYFSPDKYPAACARYSLWQDGILRNSPIFGTSGFKIVPAGISYSLNYYTDFRRKVHIRNRGGENGSNIIVSTISYMSYSLSSAAKNGDYYLTYLITVK